MKARLLEDIQDILGERADGEPVIASFQHNTELHVVGLEEDLVVVESGFGSRFRWPLAAVKLYD